MGKQSGFDFLPLRCAQSRLKNLISGRKHGVGETFSNMCQDVYSDDNEVMKKPSRMILNYY